MNIVSIEELEDKQLISETANTTSQLITACYFGHVELVKYLLSSGPVDLSLVDEHGRDAALALEAGSPARMAEVAQLLIQAGMKDPTLNVYSHDYKEIVKDKAVVEALDHFNEVFSNTCVPFAALPMVPFKSPLSSSINSTVYGHRGEHWPNFHGKPAPYCMQINLEEARYVPSEMRDIALITLFANFDQPLGRTQGDGWYIRTYRTTKGLVPVEKPSSSIWPFKLFQKSAQDQNIGLNFTAQTTCNDFALYPYDASNFDISPHNLNQEEKDCFYQWVLNKHCFGSKLGGNPSVMDRKTWWQEELQPARPSYCFQLMSDPFMGIKHPAAVLIFARGTAESYHNSWYLDVQGQYQG